MSHSTTHTEVVEIDGGEVRDPGDNKYQALLDSIPQSGLKCDILFLVIKNRIAEEPDYVKKLRVIFQFNILKAGEVAAIWTCDTRTSLDGEVYRSVPKAGQKADCVLTVDDDDWVKIMVGKLNPQRAFMMSKFKIKGNIMLLQKLHALWFDLRRKGKTPELDLIQEIMVNEPLIPGIKSEAMAIEIVQRIVKLPDLTRNLNARLQMDILKSDQLVTQYWIGIYPDRKPEFKRVFNRLLSPSKLELERARKTSDADLRLIMEDDDLVLIIYGIYKVNEAIELGKLRVEGNAELLEKMKMIFERAPIMAKL